MSIFDSAASLARRCLAKPYHVYRRALWRSCRSSGDPVSFRMPDGGISRLMPIGQIPEYLFMGWFEELELRLVSKFLRPGMRVLDIGANIGLYSVLASRMIGPEGGVWAFEPSSETIARLRKNLDLNGCANVEVVQTALCDSDGGFLTLKRDPGFGDGERYVSGPSNGGDAAAETSEDGDSELVPVTTLDSWWAASSASSEPVDFLKMDVEGCEFAIFRGAIKTMAANPDIVMMFECEQKNCVRYDYSQQDVLDFVAGQGFQLFGYDQKNKKWEDSKDALLSAGNVWACRDRSRLPVL